MIQDAGGVPLAGGRRMREGMVFRISGALAGPGELAELESRHVRSVIDLRAEEEDRSAVIEWAGVRGVAYENFPIVVAGYAGGVWDAMLAAVENGTHEQFLLDTYFSLATGFGDQLAGGLAYLARGFPASFGCAAGKDRTGVMNGFLQVLLGATRETVVASYLDKAPSFEQLLPQIATLGYGRDGDDVPDGIRHLMTVHASSIEHALDSVEPYGGVEAFLRSHGLSDETLATLRAELVE